MYRASPYRLGDRVQLARDWPQVATAGELTGVVVGFCVATGRAVIESEPLVTYVAPNDRYWSRVSPVEG